MKKKMLLLLISSCKTKVIIRMKLINKNKKKLKENIVFNA